MNKEQISQLTEEVRLANIAKHAYESYIKQHIEISRANIHASFAACDIGDIETMKNLKCLLAAIDGLELSVLNDIDTGNMANITLEKDNGN